MIVTATERDHCILEIETKVFRYVFASSCYYCMVREHGRWNLPCIIIAYRFPLFLLFNVRLCPHTTLLPSS